MRVIRNSLPPSGLELVLYEISQKTHSFLNYELGVIMSGLLEHIPNDIPTIPVRSGRQQLQALHHT